MMLMAAPLTALAIHGAWSDTASGPQLSVGKQVYKGRALRPSAPLPSGAVLSRISWRISLLVAPPPGLEIKLCSVRTCIRLDRLIGQKAAPLPFSPDEELRFIYTINAPGQQKPPVHVVANQITINYYWKNRSGQ